MAKKYQLEYDFTSLAIVEIDSDIAPIKDMVDFWSGAEDRLAASDGDYNLAWLKQLGSFILLNRRLPSDDEGWCPLTAEHGITITGFEIWTPDEDEIEIEKL
ncbi:MAG: hypothetical protein ABIS50_15270 [Luteolibacter sp.]|uniref:hypothetical protein n=1 Tax=Luteolibacter sp. TaxID=1962973 RepID=UPI003262DF7D